jgi:hypothetical protein
MASNISRDVTTDIIAKDDTKAGTDSASKNFDKLNKKVGDSGKSADKLGGKWKNAWAGIGTASAAGVAYLGKQLFDFAKDSVSAFTEAEESQAKLTDAYARFPKLADENIDKLRALNTALEAKTKFDDDALASGEAVLAQFGLSGKQLAQYTPLLADYAAKTGKDIPTAASALGKAFLGNTKALKDLGINYKSTGNKAKDIPAIMKLVNDKVGGFAEQQGKTAAGQAAILSNEFGELKETLGSKLLPIMLKAADIGLKLIDWVSKNTDVVLPFVAVIAAVTIVQWAWNAALAANPIALVVIAVAALAAGIYWVATRTTFFQTIWNQLWGFMKAVGAWFAGPFVDFFKSAFDFIIQWFKILYIDPWTTAWDLITTAAKAVGRWFSQTLPNFFKAGWDQITGDLSKTHDWIIDKWDALIGFIKGVPGKITAAAKGMWDGVKNGFKDALNWLIDQWNKLDFGIHIHIPSWVPGGVGGKGIDIDDIFPDVPHLGSGGQTWPGQMYMVGDRGPELFMPSEPGRIIPNGQLSPSNSSTYGDTIINVMVPLEELTQIIDVVEWADDLRANQRRGLAVAA